MPRERIEKVVKITDINAPSLKYPQWGRTVEFKDLDGNEYEWETMSFPNPDVSDGETWTVKMTILERTKSLFKKYIVVERVKFIKKELS